MGTAFEITTEDVHTVLTVDPRRISARYLREHGLSDDDLMTLADQLLTNVASAHDARIEKAALFGLDMDKQTVCAQNEITQILTAEGVLLKNDHNGEPVRFRNHYECPECEEAWEDDWSCQVDDECPSCARHISPYESEVL